MEKQKQNHPLKKIAEQSEAGEAIKLFLRCELVRNSLVNPFLCFLQNRKCFCKTVANKKYGIGRGNWNILIQLKSVWKCGIMFSSVDN